MNSIRLFRIVPSMLSLFVFVSVSRYESGQSVHLFFLSTDEARQEAVVGSAQPVAVARARAPRDEVVQHCLEYLGY